MLQGVTLAISVIEKKTNIVIIFTPYNSGFARAKLPATDSYLDNILV